MISLPVALFIFGFIAVATLFYGIGYFDAQHIHLKARQILEDSVTELELSVSNLNQRLATDPERAAIDHGMTYALNQMTHLIDEIRDAINHRVSQEKER